MEKVTRLLLAIPRAGCWLELGPLCLITPPAVTAMRPAMNPQIPTALTPPTERCKVKPTALAHLNASLNYLSKAHKQILGSVKNI